MKLIKIFLSTVFFGVMTFALTGCPDKPGENNEGHGHSHSSLQPLSTIQRA
jgi:hypothetical protein